MDKGCHSYLVVIANAMELMQLATSRSGPHTLHEYKLQKAHFQLDHKDLILN